MIEKSITSNVAEAKINTDTVLSLNLPVTELRVQF